MSMLSCAGDALSSGARVSCYCLDAGVEAIECPELQALKERGLHLFACAYGARRRGIELREQAVFSGLALLSELMAKADDWVIFDHSTVHEPKERLQPQQSGSPVQPDSTGDTRKPLLVVVESDPRLSDRAAEAIRLTAGLASWGDLQVSLLLKGVAAALLAQQGSPMVDAEVLDPNLGLLEKYDVPVLVRDGNDHLPEVDDCRVKPTLMDACRVADWVGRQKGIVRF